MIIDTQVLVEDMQEYEKEHGKTYTKLPFHTVWDFIDLVEQFPRCIEFALAGEVDFDKIMKGV
jgi:hypothetical protein